ncbi:prolyl oligopeptidase family serine peptidase [Georgenia sp. MJ173]|uniref:alpha/beta hydrolase family protein n=1 Tax=Georgenia sunbinii TaxID=3117728 RepID=UPI002F26B92E
MDAGGLEELQREVRAAVLDGIGGPLPGADGPVVASHRGAAELPPGTPYRVERLTVTVRPGVPVPANLYLPASPVPEGGRPAVLFLAGHSDLAKAEPDYQRACGAFAARGYVVLSFDPVGQGERHGYLDDDGAPLVAPGTTEHTYAGLACWWAGLSPARYFVDDACRALDYLLQRDDVDPARVVATGSSGGGMLTTLLMALDPRLAGAAPATYVTSREAYLPTGGRQDAEQILLGGTQAGVDHDALLMTMAPRGVCVLAAQSDFFPIEGTLATVERAKEAWAVLGVPRNFELVQQDCAHRYHPALADRAVVFFDRLLGHESAVSLAAAEVPVLPAGELQCTGSGQVAQEPGGSRFIHDRLREEVEPVPSVAVEDARRWLREQVYAGRTPAAAHVRYLPADGAVHALWQSDPGLWGAGILLGGQRPPVERILLLDGGSADLTDDDWLADGTTLVLDVRGRGVLAPHERDGRRPEDQASTVYKILSDLLWLGDSLAAGQVFDVIRAIELFAPDGVALAGVGYGAYLARLAAFIDPRVRSLAVSDEYVDPDRSWRERLYDEGRGAWHGIIPGLVRRAPWPVIVAATHELRH